MVMESVVHNQIYAHTRWLKEKTAISESVGLQKAWAVRVLRSHSLLACFIVAVERTEIKIRRCVGDILVYRIGAEDI